MIAMSPPTQPVSTPCGNDASPYEDLAWLGQISLFDTSPTPSPAAVRAFRLPPLPRVVIDENEDPFAADEGHIRFELVNRVRKQIAQGLYESDDKIDAMLDRLALDLGGW